MDGQTIEKLWTVSQTARALVLSSERIRALADAGTLPAVRIGKATGPRMFVPADVLALKQRRADKAATR